jgi:hypothetical protein
VLFGNGSGGIVLPVFRELLQGLLTTPGATYCCIADGVLGKVLDSVGAEDSDGPDVPLAVLGWGATAAGFLATAADDELDDLILTSRRAYHLVRQFESSSGHPLLIYMRLDRGRANLALARRGLASAQPWSRPAQPSPPASDRPVPLSPPDPVPLPPEPPPSPASRPAGVTGSGSVSAVMPSSQVRRPSPSPRPDGPTGTRRTDPARRPSPVPRNRPRPSPYPRAGPAPPAVEASPPPSSPEPGRPMSVVPVSLSPVPVAPAPRTPLPSPTPRPLPHRTVAALPQPRAVPATAPASPQIPAQAGPPGEQPDRRGTPKRWADDLTTMQRLLSALRNLR